MALGLATGAYEASARAKIGAERLDVSGMSAAYAEDGPTREEVLRAACARAESDYGAASRVVYVGDAVWDVRTCRNLAWPFIGRAAGARADRLRADGAHDVVPDFSDIPTLLELFETARVPG